MHLPLLPTPRSLVLGTTRFATPKALGVSGADSALLSVTLGERARPAVASQADIICELSDAIHDDEGYRLEIGEQPRVRISARSHRGVRYALATLAQILSLCPRELPSLVIVDAPAFPVRGIMLDISRDRVPTMASLRTLVAQLGSWKINHLQLYMEHTFAYHGHEEVWKASSPMTPQEMRDLDALCRVHGIELTANQNCLGHFERWLKVPGYGHLGERTSGQMAFGHWYVDPNTLTPSHPESLALVQDLLDQLIPTCSGRYVHIGCDEPWDLGQGRSQATVAAHGFHHVYTEHVRAVAGMVRAHGRRPLYWSDADHAKPEISERLPADIVPLVWDYSPQAQFATRGQLFRDRGLETWVCPGTNCWSSYTGRSWERRANLTAASEQGVAIGAHGFLTTAWGDGGHRQQWPLTLAGMADGAQAAWSGHGRFDDAAMGLHAFGDADVGRWLLRLGDADLPLRTLGSGVFADGGLTIFDPHQPGDLATWQAVARAFEELALTLPGSPGVVRDECAHAVAMASWGAARGALRRSGPTLEGRLSSARALSQLLSEHRRLWLLRSRAGGLENSSDRYRTLLAHY